MSKIKLITVKVLVFLFCVPAYPFITIGQWIERNSYLGTKWTFRDVNRDYWEEIRDVLTYKREE